MNHIEIGRGPIRVDTWRRPTINFVELTQCHFPMYTYADTMHKQIICTERVAGDSTSSFLSISSFRYRLTLSHPHQCGRSIWIIWGHVTASFFFPFPYNNEQSIDTKEKSTLESSANFSCYKAVGATKNPIWIPICFASNASWLIRAGINYIS